MLFLLNATGPYKTRSAVPAIPSRQDAEGALSCRAVKTLICTLVICAVLWPLTTRAQVETTTPEALLEKMARTYAGLKSYQDTTVAHFRNPNGSPGAQAECKIWFSRPNYFRIDGESRRAPDAPLRRDVIWADGKSARSWSTSRAVTALE